MAKSNSVAHIQIGLSCKVSSLPHTTVRPPRDIRGHTRFDPRCTSSHTSRPLLWRREAPTKISISEARRRLCDLVRQVRKDAGASVQITVRDEVVAELRAAQSEPEPGAAARKLLKLMAKLPKHRGRKTRVSSRVKAHLCTHVGGRRR